jgi:23S rRNA pseudoU1915 N3-methylase RlmH
MNNNINNFVKAVTLSIEEKIKEKYIEKFQEWLAEERIKFEELKIQIEQDMRVKVRKELENELFKDITKEANNVSIKKRGRAVRKEGELTPTEFIKSCDIDMKASEVVSKGKEIGLDFSVSLVYNTRKNLNGN